jgi:hypothetical protein
MGELDIDLDSDLLAKRKRLLPGSEHLRKSQYFATFGFPKY